MNDDKNEKISLVKAIFIVLKRRLNLKSLFFMAILLSFNSFAWFIYTNKIASGIDVHVKSWNISFEIDNEKLEEVVDFQVTELYPGMDDYMDMITVKNVGETDGRLSYEIVSVRVLDTTYVVGENDVTSEGLLTSLSSEYPFVITLGTTNDIVSHGGGEESFFFSVVWPYESGNDTFDTEWGKKAYDYYEANPDGSPIEIHLKISALQI